MSKKYYDKILSGSGTSSVKVKSAFGSKILAKYGWKEGQGLGAGMDGVKECVQVHKRAERVGIGAEETGSSEWDNWWSGAYDSVAARIAIKVGAKKKGTSTSSNSDDEVVEVKKTKRRKVESSSEEEEVVVVKKSKKSKKVIASDVESEEEEKMHKKRRVKRHVCDEPVS